MHPIPVILSAAPRQLRPTQNQKRGVEGSRGFVSVRDASGSSSRTVSS